MRARIVISGPERFVAHAVKELEDNWYVTDAGNPRSVELAPMGEYGFPQEEQDADEG